MRIFDIMQVHLQEGHFLGPNNRLLLKEKMLWYWYITGPGNLQMKQKPPATPGGTRTSFGKGPHLSWWGWRVGMASAKRQQQRSGNLQTQQQTRGSTPADWRWQLADPSFWCRQVHLLFSVWWARSFLGRQGRRDDRQDVMRRSGPVLPAGLVDYGVKRQHSSKTHTEWAEREGQWTAAHTEGPEGNIWRWVGEASWGDMGWPASSKGNGRGVTGMGLDLGVGSGWGLADDWKTMILKLTHHSDGWRKSSLLHQSW